MGKLSNQQLAFVAGMVIIVINLILFVIYCCLQKRSIKEALGLTRPRRYHHRHHLRSSSSTGGAGGGRGTDVGSKSTQRSARIEKKQGTVASEAESLREPLSPAVWEKQHRDDTFATLSPLVLHRVGTTTRDSSKDNSEGTNRATLTNGKSDEGSQMTVASAAAALSSSGGDVECPQAPVESGIPTTIHHYEAPQAGVAEVLKGMEELEEDTQFWVNTATQDY